VAVSTVYAKVSDVSDSVCDFFTDHSESSPILAQTLREAASKIDADVTVRRHRDTRQFAAPEEVA